MKVRCESVKRGKREVRETRKEKERGEKHEFHEVVVARTNSHKKDIRRKAEDTGFTDSNVKIFLESGE